jgi:hypothetical protein
MAKSFESLFLTFILVGVMVLSILAFSITFQSENQVSDPFTQNEFINRSYSDLESDLNEYSTTSQLQKTLFERETPTAGFGTLILFSIISAGKVFNGMVVGVFNILIGLPVSILGADAVLVSVFGTVLIIIIIIGLWRLYKLGG